MPKLPALFVALAALVSTVHANPAPIDLNKMLTQKEPGTHIGNTIQSATQRANDLVLTAMGFLDRPYRLGGMSAETGFDCSGFVHAMYHQSIGLKLPRRAAEQAAATRKIDKAELRPGDLVFFNTMRRPHSHVGIYVGEGKFIHAPRTGARVRVESMNVSYWQKRFDGARRVALPAEAATITPAPGVQLAAWQPGAADLAHKDTVALTAPILSDAAPATLAALQETETAASQTAAASAPAKTVIRRTSPAPRQVRLGSSRASSAKHAAAKNGKTSVRMAASTAKDSARKALASKTAKAASAKSAPATRKNAVAAAAAKKPRRV
ncbi:NlpC/P60 family protein [Comamonadaceae bacterium OH2545_COT-014]|nr:NlpC/P60 family protein [Comamonadaceae bacterium OH2545_COT-014]